MIKGAQGGRAADLERDVAPLEAASALVESAGIAGRRLRAVVAMLTEESLTLASLIRDSAVDRRTVESILAALGPDLESAGGRMRIAPGRAAAYRAMIDYDGLARTKLRDPLAGRLAEASALVAEMDELISAAPASREALDQVSATAETVVRRALWLDSTFDLAGARLLCVGDHDLTSVAVAKVNPKVAVSVVDIDDRLLEFIDAAATAAGLDVRCWFADFRLGLAEPVRAWGDLVLTDPPYTADGVRLFLGRGLEGLRDRDHGRVVMAYGFGEDHPGLGLKVQQAIAGLQLVYETVLPDFNRYHAAQAVGSSSDLYVLRPTSRSWRVAEKVTQELVANIYTHGPQSLEASAGRLAEATAEAVRAAATGPRELPLAGMVGEAWPRQTPGGRVGLGTLLTRGLPPSMGGQNAAVAVDLSADPGGGLVRVLLATDAARLAVLVPNDHPDLVNQSVQRALLDLFAPKYRLRLRRSAPESRHALVEADRVDPAELATAARVVRWVLDRPHGKLANTWREGLIKASRRSEGEPLTKNEAREIVDQAASRRELLDLRLIDLPRHQIRDLLAQVEASAAAAAP